MSRAFDTISRGKLLKILEVDVGLDKDAIRMVEALLRDTNLRVQIDGIKSDWFKTTIGTPQGDCLSPVLFVVYLEAALRSLRSKIGPRSTEDADTLLPREIVYADDTDLISFCKEWLESVLTQIPSEFAKYNLIVNDDKT